MLWGSVVLRVGIVLSPYCSGLSSLISPTIFPHDFLRGRLQRIPTELAGEALGKWAREAAHADLGRLSLAWQNLLRK